jgi:hypothetical protein
MDIGTELVRVTLGIDQLYRAQNTDKGVLDREGLVPVNLTAVKPACLAHWDNADTEINALERQALTEQDHARRAYLWEMLDSLRALVMTFRGMQLTYAERVARCLRVPGQPVPAETLEHYRETIAQCLHELGYNGANLAAEVVRWENEQRVPDEQVLPLLSEMLHQASIRTRAKMLAFPEGMLEPVGVRAVPFAAYCDYRDRKLHLNLDHGYTRPALKHLACHEGFPGHYVHLAVREEKTRNGEMPLDAALVVTSSASSAFFEGIAENGIYFLDWVEGADDVLGMTLNRLRAAARINAAWMIHAEARPRAEVIEFLMTSCMESRAWAESRLAFLTHPLRAPFIFAYWYGDMAVAQLWARVTPERRVEFWHYLYEKMHTPTTLTTFWN